MSVAIKIENLSKQYRLGLVSTRTLSHDLNRWWQTSILGREDPYLKIGETNIRDSKGTSEYVWALKDINLVIEEGEILGIIGKNGAGKSTLLKILSKVTSPTTGVIKARGRIASLLEVGTGFHQEMTGRENIYLNGAIMGMTKKEISLKLDEIVNFAGVERYLDTPVKRYSSGMAVRLGFSVAAHLEPDILVVDEVLAVGDAEFQKKAIGKMQNVSQDRGRTILFVSHNLEAVKTLCSEAIIIKDGEISNRGNVHRLIEEYTQENKFKNHLNYPKTKEIIVNDVYIEHDKEKPLTNMNDLYIIVDYSIYNYLKELRMVITLKVQDQIIFQVSDYYLIKQRNNKGKYFVRIKIPQKFLGKELYSLFIRFDIPSMFRVTNDIECLNFKLDTIEFNQMGYQATGEPKGFLHPEIKLELITRE